MSAILAVAGVLLLIVTLIDLVKTTITLRGAGPITSRLTSGLWRLASWVHRRVRSNRLMAYAGPGMALLTVMGWVAAAWLGWFLILAAGSPGLVDSRNGASADLWARLYYAGYTFFTLGLGDYRPVGPIWQMVTVLAVGNGFLTVSLSTAYLIPLVSAAARLRQLAIYINGLGKTPSDVLVSAWNGRDFSALGQHLASLAPMVAEVGQQHLIYPILHYYHGPSPETSLPVGIAKLDEALHLLQCGVVPDHRMAASTITPVNRGIESLLASLNRLHLAPVAGVPPLPSLEPLRRAGIPVVGEDQFRNAMQGREARRRLTLSLVEETDWRWADLDGTAGKAAG